MNNRDLKLFKNTIDISQLSISDLGLILKKEKKYVKKINPRTREYSFKN